MLAMASAAYEAASSVAPQCDGEAFLRAFARSVE